MASSKARSTAPSRRSRTRRQPKSKIKNPTVLGALGVALGSWRPPPRRSVREWAESERVVAHEEGPEPGPWKTKVYQVAPLEAVSDRANHGVVFIAASQGGGKTSVALNVAGYFIDDEPSPMLIVEPTLDTAKAFSKDRLAPMIRESPALRGKVSDPRTRDADNTVLHKRFAGGHLTIVGANSAAGLAMRPIRVVIFDEVDRYPPSAGSEGDPIKLAEARTEAYLWNAVKFYASSPGEKSTSRLWQLWQKTDRQEFFVACPDCNHEQFLKWAQVQWEKDEDGEAMPETAVYACEACGSAWSDAQRWAAIRRGRYKATARFRGWRGFRLPGMAILGRRLAAMAEEWLDAQGNPELLKAFVNTKLCEWWEDRSSESLDVTVVAKRREDWSNMLRDGATLPPGVAAITAGVDCQPDRLELEFVGWGRGEESWSLDYVRLEGDLRRDPTVLQDLDAQLERSWTTALGHRLYLRAAAVDTGFAAQTIYRWSMGRLTRFMPSGFVRFVFPVKGRSDPNRPVWPVESSKARKAATRLWIVGSDAAKDQVMGRLAIEAAGPGYCHVPVGRPISWFEGLLAEEPRTRYRRGVAYRAWELKKPVRPNEPLDCRVYAYAALEGIRAPGYDFSIDDELVRLSGPPTDGGPVSGGGGVSRARQRRVRSRGVEA